MESTQQEEAFWVLGHRVRPLETRGDFGLVEIVSYPDVPGPPPHHHEGVSEFFYVADGCLDVQVDGAWTRLETGDSLSLAPGQVHTLINRSETPCRWITGWSPRGFERFFTDFGIPVEAADARAASASDEVLGRVAADCGAYGMIVAKPD